MCVYHDNVKRRKNSILRYSQAISECENNYNVQLFEISSHSEISFSCNSCLRYIRLWDHSTVHLIKKDVTYDDIDEVTIHINTKN